MRRLFWIHLSVLLLASAAGGQTPEPSQRQKPEESWDNLRTLQVGEKIQVVDQKLKSQDGRFRSVSDEAITFQADQDEVSVQRADVLRVSSRKGMGRGKHALIGLAVGAGVGAIVGCADSNPEPGEQCLWMVPFALAAGGVGANSGVTSYEA